MPGTAIAEQAAQMRAAFDRSFAEAPHRDTTVRYDFLAVGIGADVYAIRLAEVAGLFADKKITPVPGRDPTLMGIAGFAGAILPVHDLRVILGYAAPGTPRWLVVAAKSALALAFDVFEGHFRVPLDAVASSEGGDTSRPHLRGMVHAHDRTRAIVDIPALLSTITTQAAPRTTRKEL
jgi:chemotaxis signal transduction protein